MGNRTEMIPVEVMLTGIDTFKKCYEENRTTITPSMFETAMRTLIMVEEFVKRTPAIYATEIVHGQTEEIDPCQITVDRQCCSCGMAMGREDNYCPNCGRLMEVKK